MGGVSRVWFRRDFFLSRFYTTAVPFGTPLRPEAVDFVKKKSPIGKADNDNPVFQLTVPMIRLDLSIRLFRTIILLLVVRLGATLPAAAAAHAPLPSALIVTRADVPRTQLTKSLETTAPAHRLASSQVPPGTEIGSSRVFWETYRWQVTGLGGVFLLQAIIISALLLQRHRRRAAQQEAWGRLQEIIRLSRRTGAGALSTSIADELNQPLASIMSNAEAAEILLARSPPDTGQVKEILVDIRKADQHAAELIQCLSRLLKRPTESELKDFDLKGAVPDAWHDLSSEARKQKPALSRAPRRTVFRFGLPLIKNTL